MNTAPINTTNTTQLTNGSVHTAAIAAGVGLLLMAVIAPFANFYVFERLIVVNDASLSVSNIAASATLFRLGIAGFLVVAVLDVIVAWGLYVVFEPVNKNLSLLAAWFRIVYTAVLVFALNPLWGVAQLLSGANELEASQLQTQVMLSLSAFRTAWDLGLVLFGVHLLVLGVLVFQSGFLPRWLGVLLGIASVGYVVDSLGKLLVPGYSISIAAFTFIGEFLLIFWLLWYGIMGARGRASVQPQTVISR